MQYKEPPINPPDGPEIACEREYLARTTDSDVYLYVDLLGGHIDLTYQAEFKLSSVEWADEVETWHDPELVAIVVGKFGEDGYFRIPAEFLDSDTVRQIDKHLEKEVANGAFTCTEEI